MQSVDISETNKKVSAIVIGWYYRLIRAYMIMEDENNIPDVSGNNKCFYTLHACLKP